MKKKSNIFEETKHSFRLLRKAFLNTTDEMIASVWLLSLLTLVLSGIYYVIELTANPNGGINFWQTIIYFFSLYVEDPADIGGYKATTYVGKLVITLVGYVGVLIFAIPAGLIACGFSDAVHKEAREKELNEFREKLRKSFRSRNFKNLNKHIESTVEEGKDIPPLYLVPAKRAVEWLQAHKGISIQNIVDTVNRFHEFRMVNIRDRFFIESFPLNRPYGCCINRHSLVTIISPSSCNDMGMGWFAYYVAKFGGFNLISKEIEIDIDETDSFYNITAEPMFNGKSRAAYNGDTDRDNNAIEILDRKQRNREMFFEDLKALAAECKNGRPWFITMVIHNKNSVNTADFHFADNNKGGNRPAVVDSDVYNALFDRFSTYFKETHSKETVKSTRYPLPANNLYYRLNDSGTLFNFNGFVLRPSAGIVESDDQKTVLAYDTARIMGEVLGCNTGIRSEELNDFRANQGYAEQDVDNPELQRLLE
ncbi:MAG: hypothetical protein IKL29_09805 [Bacteroidaceae bacterium]|nr:hypothetical protein [Bacteroidaceae bacterium]